MGFYSSDPGYGQLEVSYENGNELFGVIKTGNDMIINY
jgi:hypothetical protein